MIAQELAAMTTDADSKAVGLVVAGPNGAKAKTVLLDAIGVVGHGRPHLRILFLGSDGDTMAARDALGKIGVTVVPPAGE